MQEPVRRDQLVTVIGGDGFIGRQVCERLLAAGVRVRIATRDPARALAVKPLGTLGQTQIVRADVTRRDDVVRAVAGASAVVNLVGVFGPAMDRINDEAAGVVAETAAMQGAVALVHVSAIGADLASPSRYGRSKAAGEHAVRTAFPNATIMRPSIVFGRGDQFVNRFARMARAMPVMPVIGGATRFQPVYVGDVAQAIATAALYPDGHGGTTYELGGPEVVTMRELVAWVTAQTGHSRPLVDVPASAARMLATGLGWAPGAPITRDQLRMLDRDNVVARDAATIAAFGIAPRPLAAVAPGWLSTYRKAGRFGQPREAG